MIHKTHTEEVVSDNLHKFRHEVKTAPSWLFGPFRDCSSTIRDLQQRSQFLKQLSIPILKVQFSTFSRLLIQLFTSCAMNHQNDHLKTDTFNLDHFSDPLLQSSLKQYRHKWKCQKVLTPLVKFLQTGTSTIHKTQATITLSNARNPHEEKAYRGPLSWGIF